MWILNSCGRFWHLPVICRIIPDLQNLQLEPWELTEDTVSLIIRKHGPLQGTQSHIYGCSIAYLSQGNFCSQLVM